MRNYVVTSIYFSIGIIEMPYKNIPKIGMQFGERLRELRSEKSLSQEEMANRLYVSQSKISDWERGGRGFPSGDNIERLIEEFGPHIVQWLLSLETAYSNGSIDWVENIPHNLDADQQEIVTIGLGLLHAVMLDGYDLPTIKTQPPFNRHSLSNLYQAFKSVVRKNYLQIIRVHRNNDIEQQLLVSNRQNKSFPYLKEVIVADVDDTDATLLLTEFIVHLCIQEVFQKVRGIQSIGVCSGYTMLRLSEQVALNRTLFNSIHWIPLMGYPKDRISVNSANHIALTLASRYGGTPFRMPFVTYSEDKEEEQKILDEVRSMAMAFITVNGAGRRAKSYPVGEYLGQMRYSDYFPVGTVQSLYDELEKEGTQADFSGEILGYMLDHNAHPVGSEEFQQIHRSRVNAIPLSLLSDIASAGHVWLLAAREYKAEPTFMALKNGLASAVIIDNTIARHLLKRMEEQS